MKLRSLVLFSLLVWSRAVSFAEPPGPAPSAEKSPIPDQLWSLAGTWDCTHPAWHGAITLEPDGTLLGTLHEPIGQWMLHVQDDHVLFLLCRKDSPIEAAGMVGSDEFLGAVKDGLLRMRRQPPDSAAPHGFPLPSPSSFASAGPLWSLLGTWDATHGAAWSAPLTFRADNTFLKGGAAAEGGRWAMSTQGGRLLLILFWNYWSAEVTTLVDADRFSGAPAYCDLRLHRRPAAVSLPSFPAVAEETPVRLTTGAPSAPGKPAPGALVEFSSWRQGEPPVKLIRKDEGFCALTKVTGHFEGGDEGVKVYVGGDGYWYLDGYSEQDNVGAECVVVRYCK